MISVLFYIYYKLQKKVKISCVKSRVSNKVHCSFKIQGYLTINELVSNTINNQYILLVYYNKSSEHGSPRHIGTASQRKYNDSGSIPTCGN